MNKSGTFKTFNALKSGSVIFVVAHKLNNSFLEFEDTVTRISSVSMIIGHLDIFLKVIGVDIAKPYGLDSFGKNTAAAMEF